MDSNDIKYYIDNRLKIAEELNKFLETLPEETLNNLEKALSNNNIEQYYNIIVNIDPNFVDKNRITVFSIKLLFFLEYSSETKKLYTEKEYFKLLTNIIDIYGENITEIIDCKYFNINDLDLLNSNFSKYSKVYKSILKDKLSKYIDFDNSIEFLKTVNHNAITEDLIIEQLSNYNFIINSSVRKLLKILPNSILEDGKISKIIIKKLNYKINDCQELLNYLPESAYEDVDFLNEILNVDSSLFVEFYFEHIPKKIKDIQFWEKVCKKYPFIKIINNIPNEKINSDISQQQYNEWKENLVIESILNVPKDAFISFFKKLDNSKKTVNLCEQVVQYIKFKDKNDIEIFLNSIPEESRTQKIYEILLSKSSCILKDIPLQSFIPDISQKQYDKWLENLILVAIANSNNLSEIYYSIPNIKINERIWNKLMDKYVKRDNYNNTYVLNEEDKNILSLKNVEFENITPQMIERAMKQIGKFEVINAPCINRNIENLHGTSKEKYLKWQNSFSKEQKEDYQKWYEKIWIESIPGLGYQNVYNKVPKEALTFQLKKACIDYGDYISIERMPIPETSEELMEYQQLIIYALNKFESIFSSNSSHPIFNFDILKNISTKYINEEIINRAIQISPIYLKYADLQSDNFDELLDIAYKKKLINIGRNRLTTKEKNIIKKFFINNDNLFSTLELEILDSKIVDCIGEFSLESIVRYPNIEELILKLSNDLNVLKTFEFCLNNLKEDQIFLAPLIEKIIKSIRFNPSICEFISTKIDNNIPFSDYEKAIIPYLALNFKECHKITNYDEIINYVKRKNAELENIMLDSNSTLLEIKNAYLERTIGLNYESVINLITIYGNDPESLLQNYINIIPTDYEKLSEKEAIEIIIKLKKFIEIKDIDAIKMDILRFIALEKNNNIEQSYIRYQKATVLENFLRRAYGRDIIKSLSENVDYLQEELEFNGEKYVVRKIYGNFNKMVSLLDAYRKSSATEGDMYDRWNTNKMAKNHALCFSLINQSNPGTAGINGKNGIIISFNGFIPDSVLAAAPYDLNTFNSQNTIEIGRQTRFFTAKNMPNYTRGNYSEYDIEIQDVSSNKYKKIQPSSIICFEEVDEDSIRAAIELGKKIGHQVPIELIDRRKLAKEEMKYIMNAFTSFKNSKNIDSTLVGEIITRFNNVRNAHRYSSLSNELIGETPNFENEDALFNKKHLNEILKECINLVGEKIRDGQVQAGLNALKDIKNYILEERQHSFLMPTMYEKQDITGIDTDIDYAINELQRIYGQPIIKPLLENYSIETLLKLNSHEFESITFNIEKGLSDFPSEQLTPTQILQCIDISQLQKDIFEIHEEGFYQENQIYDEEHISRVILYSEVISKMEGYDDKTRKLLVDVAKYYSCGRQLDVAENHEKYSAKLAGKVLSKKYSQEEIKIIQAAIELQNFKPTKLNSLEKFEDERKIKNMEICNKYKLNQEQQIIANKIANCISDAVILDQTRFVDKVYSSPESSFLGDNSLLKSSTAKKMVKFSYSMQDCLAQQKLEKLSNIVKIDFNDFYVNSSVMEIFFTEIFNGNSYLTKDKKIIESPIVKLEYLKNKFPEIIKFNLGSSDDLSLTKEQINSIQNYILHSNRLSNHLQTRDQEENIISNGMSI